MRYLRIGWLAILLMHVGLARAELNIEITKGIDSAVPIAVVPFSNAPMPIASVISADLARSGYFKAMSERAMLEKPTTPEAVNFSNWKLLAQEYVAIGQVEDVGGGRYATRFFLLDVFKGGQVASYSFPPVPADGLRRVAHQIADIIYQSITGKPGAFNTRISYVTTTRTDGRLQYQLQVADADGHDARVVLTSPEPIMSPAWSPDGKRLAYVSFENRTPAIFIQDLTTAERQMVSQYPGINGAPAWSPDGSKLAMTLSKDGNPEIYVMDVATRALRRITDDSAIDTEATWTHDGQIIFTSDRGGGPQLYLVSANGGRESRLTRDGSYNARARVSPDGRTVAMIHGNGGRYQIALMDLRSRELRVLTDGALDESPSFAPNGAMILYASRESGQTTLAAISLDGRVKQRLSSDLGEVRQPAWSP